MSSHRYFVKTTEKNAQGHFWSVHPSFERELRTTLFSSRTSTPSNTNEAGKPKLNQFKKIGKSKTTTTCETGADVSETPSSKSSKSKATASKHTKATKTSTTIMIKKETDDAGDMIMPTGDQAAAAGEEMIVFSPLTTYPSGTGASSTAEVLNSSNGPSSNFSKFFVNFC